MAVDPGPSFLCVCQVVGKVICLQLDANRTSFRGSHDYTRGRFTLCEATAAAAAGFRFLRVRCVPQ